MDRFTVGSVAGYGPSVPPRWAELWYVHDRAYGFAIVREFRGARAESDAREWAAWLNRGTPPAIGATLELGDPRHGSHVAYGWWSCRCLLCRTAQRQYKLAREARLREGPLQ